MMPTMPPDSHKISLKIIEAIKQHPVLYINDVKGTTIKLQEFRQKVWKRISDELTLDPTWMRLKWKNLRDTYCRILKYKNKTDKGIRRKKWIFEDHLGFLKFPYEPDYQPQCIELSDEYIEGINNGGIYSQVSLEQLEDKEDEDYSEYLEVLEETAADPVLDDSEGAAFRRSHKKKCLRGIAESESKPNQQPELDEYVKQIESKYRKIRPKKVIMEETAPTKITNSYSLLKSPEFRSTPMNNANRPIDAASVSPIIIARPSVVPTPNRVQPPPQEITIHDRTKNSTELFFNSMARTVKLLPLRAQVEIKMAVCKIVTEAEMNYSIGNTYKNTQRFVAPPGMMPKLILVPCSMIDKPSVSDA